MRENSGSALALAIASITFFAILPALLVVLVYLFVTVYAIAKAFGAGGRHPDPVTVLLGVTLIVATVTTLLAVGLRLLGRRMDPRKRGEREEREDPAGA